MQERDGWERVIQDYIWLPQRGQGDLLTICGEIVIEGDGVFEKTIYFSMIFVVVKEILADMVEKQVMEETDLDLKGE